MRPALTYLTRHNFCIFTSVRDTGVKASSVMRFYDFSPKYTSSPDATVIRPLWAWETPFRPAQGIGIGIKKRVFLFYCKPRMLILKRQMISVRLCIWLTTKIVDSLVHNQHSCRIGGRGAVIPSWAARCATVGQMLTKNIGIRSKIIPYFKLHSTP